MMLSFLYQQTTALIDEYYNERHGEKYQYSTKERKLSQLDFTAEVQTYTPMTKRDDKMR